MRATLLGVLGVVALLVSVNGGVINSVDGIENEIDRRPPTASPSKWRNPCTSIFESSPQPPPRKFEWNISTNHIKTLGKLSNIVIKGLDSFLIVNLVCRPWEKHVVFDIIHPELQIEADFTMKNTVYLNGVPFNWADSGVLKATIVNYRYKGENVFSEWKVYQNTNFANAIFNNGNIDWDIERNATTNSQSQETVHIPNDQ